MTSEYEYQQSLTVPETRKVAGAFYPTLGTPFGEELPMVPDHEGEEAETEGWAIPGTDWSIEPPWGTGQSLLDTWLDWGAPVTGPAFAGRLLWEAGGESDVPFLPSELEDPLEELREKVESAPEAAKKAGEAVADVATFGLEIAPLIGIMLLQSLLNKRGGIFGS